MLLWALRVTWFALPFTTGAVLADALDDRSTAVQLTAAVLLWGAWAAVVVALLVPRPVGLVTVRVGALAAVVAAVIAAGGGRDWIVGVPIALATLVGALLPPAGEWFVNGTAYGYERRYLLRAPAAVVVGPMPFAALLLPAAVAAGPLLLAAERWVLGVVALAAGGTVAVLLARALHSMTLRWAVLVPAGIVLKDHLTLLDPVLFRRTDITVLRRAPADTDALDLTAGALGLALEIRLREEQHVERMRPVRRGSEPYEAGTVLFTPTRPAALLADAATRKFRVHA